MAALVFRKGNDLLALDRTFKELKVEVHPCNAGDHRKRLPVEMVLQNRYLAFGDPGAHSVGLLPEAALIDAHHQPAFGKGFFLIAGKR